jgi:hypothetical protein
MINRFRPSKLPGTGPIMTILRLISLFIELSIFLTVLKVFIELFGVDDGSVVLVNLTKGIAGKVAGLYATVFNLLINLGSPIFQVLRAFGEGLLENEQVKAHYDFLLGQLISYLSAFQTFVMKTTGLGAIITFIQTNNGILGAAGEAVGVVTGTIANATSAAKDAVVDQVTAVLNTAADFGLSYIASGFGSIAGLLQSTYVGSVPALTAPQGSSVGFTQLTLPGSELLSTVYIEYLATNATNVTNVTAIDLPVSLNLPEDFKIPPNMGGIIDATGSNQLPVPVPMFDVEDIEVLELNEANFLTFDFEVIDLRPFNPTTFEGFDINEFYIPYPESPSKGGYKNKNILSKVSQISKTSIPFKDKKFSINLMRDVMIAKFKQINDADNINKTLTIILGVNALNSHLSMKIVFFCESSIKLYVSDLILRGEKKEKEIQEIEKNKITETETAGGKRRRKSRKHMKHKTHKRIKCKNKKGSKRRYKKRDSKRRYKK